MTWARTSSVFLTVRRRRRPALSRLPRACRTPIKASRALGSRDPRRTRVGPPCPSHGYDPAGSHEIPYCLRSRLALWLRVNLVTAVGTAVRLLEPFLDAVVPEDVLALG